MKASEKMEGVFDLAVEEIEKVFKGIMPVTDKTRIAVSSMGIYSRHLFRIMLI